MDKGTATDLNPVAQVTEEQARDFRLDPHLLRLMWDEPFFSHVLRSVTKIRTDRIPTAGVLAKDGDIKMWYNPAFMAGLTPDQIKGLLKHECYHLVFHHTTTRRKDPHHTWNWATDLAINSLIPEPELPAGGLIPGKQFDDLTEEQLQFLIDQLEEESLTDQDYYINASTLDHFEEAGADPALLSMLKNALGDNDSMDIRWQSA